VQLSVQYVLMVSICNQPLQHVLTRAQQERLVIHKLRVVTLAIKSALNAPDLLQLSAPRVQMDIF
jgi:hypothetical protein